ncbi:hypothetical protein NPS70_17530 [Streptomyces sp. C10-9-1]|uniref:hypothetical protein n=1 Tax=Streptomyces sp. C10-9-1 TaxID=1859285 RepID=UPI002112EBDB|nr:hypothetical protein [Streptomyces sp. C10-9-1]MCQ6554981.1 hypothetical protein [Streptomyces sp. C10-9-1]
MPRHPRIPLLAAVAHALLLAAVLCFTPLGEAAHHHAGTRTAAAASFGTDHSEDRSPRHPHRGHTGSCTAPGLTADTHLATRHAPDAGEVRVSCEEAPATSVSRAPSPPNGRAPTAESGRSTQIRVCRWRV